MPSACVTQSVSSPEAAWVGEAPTATSPASTTAKELEKPTRATTTPASTGLPWAGASGASSVVVGTGASSPR